MKHDKIDKLIVDVLDSFETYWTNNYPDDTLIANSKWHVAPHRRAILHALRPILDQLQLMYDERDQMLSEFNLLQLYKKHMGITDLSDITEENVERASRFAKQILTRYRAYPSEYDPSFGDDKRCACGHPYYRHFDTYDDMYPIGCKYCNCVKFN